MRKTYKKILIAVIVLGFLAVAANYLHHSSIAVLNPKGPVAYKERKLIFIALALALIVVIPVYTLTILFAWRYRETNTKAKYSPELDGNKIAETIWWLIPSIIITVLAVIAWDSSHQLDPYKPLSSTTPPLTIQVVSLDWKWLFIYPQQNIASVNLFQFPKNTPLSFELTSDSVMNSFWIPQLGGQMYVMPGMSTQLHLMASQYGSFSGSSANISGQGFAGMTFTAKSSSNAAFNSWVKNIKDSSSKLSMAQYNKLLQPSEYNPPSYYASAQTGLYNTIIDKYLAPGGQMMGMAGMSE
ncbi:MAG TPA: ubiquinol oxidase subunit II [Candidatus Saccharimonadales bacterium]|nr:ubiquinol oxidase subunit II [Candidatus Saccharimonadales bacterium]